jgi:hypothetical protein
MISSNVQNNIVEIQYTYSSLKIIWWPLKGPFGYVEVGRRCLTSETVQSTALTLERVDDVHGSDGLALGVLAVGDSVTDDVLEEQLQHTPDLFVDETRDTLDTSSASQTADGRLRDALDVVTENLAMTLGATFPKTLASFATSRHVDHFSV